MAVVRLDVPPHVADVIRRRVYEELTDIVRQKK